MPREDLPFTPELQAQLRGKQVRVHRNLNNGLWSVTHNGKVVAHAEQVKLQHVTFIVGHKSRERAKRERTRNVHAWAEGILVPRFEAYPCIGVTYHPFLHAGFVFERNPAELVHQATEVAFTNRHQCLAANINQLLL